MKRRNFLKAIGIGAVISPAMVKATEFKHEEYSLPLKTDRNRKIDLALHKLHIRDNPYAKAMGQTTGSIHVYGGLTVSKNSYTLPSKEDRQAVSDAFFPPFSQALKWD